MWPLITLLMTFLAAGGLAPQSTKEQAIEAAKAALREEPDVGDGALVVRRADAVEWPDAGLGCPEEGKSYAQVVTPGFRVLLQVNAKVYRVHVGEGRAVVCGKPMERMGAGKLPERAPQLEEAEITGEVPEDILDAILDDLTKRAGADPNAAQQQRTEALVWPDGSLGCPKPGEVYTQAPVNGYRVVLEYNGKRYDYRATQRGYFFLCEGSLTPEIRSR